MLQSALSISCQVLRDLVLVRAAPVFAPTSESLPDWVTEKVVLQRGCTVVEAALFLIVIIDKQIDGLPIPAVQFVRLLKRFHNILAPELVDR